MSVLLHPSVIVSGAMLIDSFMALSRTQQIVLATLVKAKVASMEASPLADSLAAMMRVLGSIPRELARSELHQAEEEIYATLQIIAARERGEVPPPLVEEWYRDIS